MRWPRRAHGPAIAVLVLLATAGLTLAQQQDAAARWTELANAARSSEDALSQLTLSFFRQMNNNGTNDANNGQQMRNALQTIGQQASKSGLLNLIKDSMAGNVRSFQDIDMSPAFVTPDLLRGGIKLAASVFVNELATPRARIVERAQQLGQIATDIIYGSEACGAYTFNPGGAPVNAMWVGPTFTLTQTTGNCVVRTEFAGEGNTRWTRLQESLVCQGPDTQWEWTPLTYMGVTRERTSLEGPECKTEVQFGTEATITLYGGDSKDKIVFATEKEFYAAMVVNKTFDFRVMPLKTALENVQVRLDHTQQKWHDALYKEVDAASAAGATTISGAELAAKVAQRYQQMQQNMKSASSILGKWTNADGTFRQGVYMQQLANKLASGGALTKGVGRSLFGKSS